MAEQARACTAYYNGVPFPVSDVRIDLGYEPPPEGMGDFDFGPTVFEATCEIQTDAEFRRFVRHLDSLTRRARKKASGRHDRWTLVGRINAFLDYTPLGGVSGRERLMLQNGTVNL